MRRIRRFVLFGLCTLAGPSACSLNDLVNKAAVPVDMRDPSKWENEAGALALYQGAINELRTIANGGMNNPIAVSALLTDEMSVVFSGTNPPAYPGNSLQIVDARVVWDNLTSGIDTAAITASYNRVQNIRIQANTARQYLQRFGQRLPTDLMGHTFVVEAYAIWYLAELFCSGVPLSTMNFDGSYTLGSGTSYENVISQGIQLLDSADATFVDSADIATFSRLLRARFLLAQNRYDAAASIVQGIAPTFVRQIQFSTDAKNFLSTTTSGTWGSTTIADLDGGNGLDFVSSNDPRTLTIATASGVRFPARFRRDGSSPITLISGVEGVLIRAEASLRDGDTAGWLAALNSLRNAGIERIEEVEGAAPDTVWTPSAVASLYAEQSPPFPGLPDLKDPGSDTARVRLLFRERAFWLFLTGNRQADLRRLIRQYDRLENEVYPTGRWGPLGFTSYGSDVSLPVPAFEVLNNHHYSGCMSRDA